MTDSLIGKLRARGEEVLSQVSAQLMSNPQFMKAVEGALKGKQKLDSSVGQVLKQMNIPTRSEFKRALLRIEALERDLAEVQGKAAQRKPRAPRRPSAKGRRKAPAKPVAAE